MAAAFLGRLSTDSSRHAFVPRCLATHTRLFSNPQQRSMSFTLSAFPVESEVAGPCPTINTKTDKHLDEDSMQQYVLPSSWVPVPLSATDSPLKTPSVKRRSKATPKTQKPSTPSIGTLDGHELQVPTSSHPVVPNLESITTVLIKTPSVHLLSIDSVTPKCALSEDQQPLEPTTEHSDRFFRSPTKVALAFPPMARGEPLHTEKENADSLARIISECNSLYLEQADAFMNATLPPKPNHWVQKSGWTRYNTDGSTMSVEHPTVGEPLVFDVEVMFRISAFPAMAVAVSPTAWYSWCAVPLVYKNSLRKTLDKRISLGPPGIPRVVVGHNVTYDRARIQEEYLEEPTSIAYICTMALNIALFRYNARETMVWIKLMEGKTSYALEPVPQGYWDCSGNSDKRLVTASTCNGLKHLVKLHLGETMDKSTRDLFSGHHLSSIRSPTTFQEAMRYCAEDVALTHGLYKKLFSMFRQEFPDTASFAMMLRMAPRANMQSFHIQCREFCDLLHGHSEQQLQVVADEIATQYQRCNSDAVSNSCLGQLDWTIRQHKHLGERPNWYCSFWVSAKVLMKWSSKKAATPYLLQLRWDGHEMLHSKEYGWVYYIRDDPQDLVSGKSKAAASKLDLKKLKFTTDETSDDFEPLFLADSSRIYFRVPHSDGKNARCGSPLHQGFYYAINNGRLSSGSASGQRYLELFARTLYWERIKSLYE
ncbi:hypothetical protein BASA50_008681 [Batrachochytrium salamandrivorans]|uniref:DNA mitochondrial polymerase exonuclease domain-containing protein n=1 Tax=Batrachochytrium salamandrivorans TaxID=1357716 RepID=A0ABQ8F3M0_9FUNG|nr:hypothetical protein BASA50_008681 [Batrachochytrium salamandrivorans]KAH6602211.1 hypothetical protein BASA61_001335 [Batrachochytrium salamandrivorans]KAH9274789.1 hypothetical protein BASA83_002996 [Batrachochytrium salamandrivorans]